MDVSYLQDLLDKYDSIKGKKQRLSDIAQDPLFPESSLYDLNKERLKAQKEEDNVLAQIEQEKFNENANKMYEAEQQSEANNNLLGDVASFGQQEPNMTPALPEKPVSEGLEFDGSLQSNPEDHKYDDIGTLISNLRFKTGDLLEGPMSKGEPASFEQGVKEETKKEENKKEPSKKDFFYEELRSLRNANPEVPLSQLMEEAQKRADQREADLLYQRAAINLLNVDNKGKPYSTKRVDNELSKLNEKYKQDVAIATQKEKERQKEPYRDANSEISKSMRSIAKKLGLQIDKDTTAEELINSGLDLGKLAGLQSNKDINEYVQKMKQKMTEDNWMKKSLIDSQKVDAKNRDYFLDMQKRVLSLMRGSSFKDLDTKTNAIAEMKAKLEQALNGNVPMNEASAKDLSAVWSKALTGGIPAQALIEQTLPTTIKSDFAKGINYLANRPVMDYLSKKNLQLMKKQMDLLEKAVNIRKGEKLAEVYNSYHDVIDSDPTFSKIIDINHGKFIKKRDDGFYEPVTPITETGKAIGATSKSETKKSQFSPRQEALIQSAMKRAERAGHPITREQAIEGYRRRGML